MKEDHSFNDKVLIASFRGIDDEKRNLALKFLYEKNYPKVLAHIKSNSGSEDEAKDVFQEAMVILFRKLKEKEFVLTSTISTYLIGISKNLWFQILRKSKRHQEFVKNEQDNAHEMVVDIEVRETSNHSIIETLMTHISEGCRTLLVNYYYKNLSSVELQKTLKLGSDQAVRNKIYKCMQKIRSICKEKNITLDNFSYHE